MFAFRTRMNTFLNQASNDSDDDINITNSINPNSSSSNISTQINRVFCDNRTPLATFVLLLFVLCSLASIGSSNGSYDAYNSMLAGENNSNTSQDTDTSSGADSSQTIDDTKDSTTQSTSHFTTYNVLLSTVMTLIFYSCMIAGLLYIARYVRERIALIRQSRSSVGNSVNINEYLSRLRNRNSMSSSNLAALMRLALSSRNFNSNDYEMLQQLDGSIDSRGRGATETAIRTLPVNIVVASDVTNTSFINDPCPICLGSFEVGDRLKKTACFHCFHEACIDPWLRTCQSCPVCKSNAFGVEQSINNNNNDDDDDDDDDDDEIV